MSEKNSDFESLSRLREIIFGEQVTKLEEEIKNLSSEQRISVDKLSKEFKTMVEEKEENFNLLLTRQKEEFLNQLNTLNETKADSKTIAETLRKLADAIDGKKDSI